MPISRIIQSRLLNLSALLGGILIIAFAVLTVTEFMAGSYFEYNGFTDRDLYRAWDIFGAFPTTGAELSAKDGGRTPGGGLYYSLQLIQLLDPAPKTIWLVVFTATKLSLIFLFYAVTRVTSVFGAAVAVSALATSQVLIDNAFTLWNPSIGEPFGILAIALFVLHIHN